MVGCEGKKFTFSRAGSVTPPWTVHRPRLGVPASSKPWEFTARTRLPLAAKLTNSSWSKWAGRTRDVREGGASAISWKQNPSSARPHWVDDPAAITAEPEPVRATPVSGAEVAVRSRSLVKLVPEAELE
jgi:hypothetical protein